MTGRLSLGRHFSVAMHFLNRTPKLGATGHCSNKTPIRSGQEKMFQKSTPTASHSTRDADRTGCKREDVL
jgi:hypothetical protein